MIHIASAVLNRCLFADRKKRILYFFGLLLLLTNVQAKPRKTTFRNPLNKFEAAVFAGDVRQVKAMIDKTDNWRTLAKPERDLILLAIDKPKMLKLLLTNGLKPSSGMCNAALHGLIESVNLLFEAGFVLDGETFACIAYSSKPEKTQILKIFLSHDGGKYVNFVTSEGTLLDVARIHTTDEEFYRIFEELGAKSLKEVRPP